MKEVGTRIKQLRKEKGLTQEQLAENLDITAGTIENRNWTDGHFY